MNLLDWLLVLLVLAYALSGYWQGFVTGAFATVGLLAGGLLGILLAPFILGDAEPSLTISLAALFIVIVCASLGQALMQFVGAKIRDQITWQPARAVDAIGGAALSALAVLLVAWALGVAVSGSKIGSLTPLVRESAVLRTVNSALPTSAPNALQAFNGVVGTSFFPRYMEPFADERIVEVGPGAERLLRDPDIAAAQDSVLKVRGNNDCGRGVEGTGFLYSDDRLMTNAHVVAGVDEPTVEIDGDQVDATVVYYNSQLDVAVLALDDLGRDPLAFVDGDAEETRWVTEAKDGVAILGYPQDGPYDVQRGRVRSEQNLRSPDIYGDGTVVREVYSLRGLIRPGNSGGPIVTTQGRVAGVVFAASVTDDDTGYALTWEQVQDAAGEGVSSSEPVSTGACA
ncbi:MarP family serine protease [Nocardioides dongxiaopingii]|uniref:MarP family serine protease n=1 Tax=Nocardioides TaxID=1839 RepID=UPI0010C76D9E|nr:MULTISPECIES: MarP family serine protease [Nocardioides]QDH10624.1 MarP family serine protease [Nocardioides sp. S-1144]